MAEAGSTGREKDTQAHQCARCTAMFRDWRRFLEADALMRVMATKKKRPGGNSLGFAEPPASSAHPREVERGTRQNSDPPFLGALCANTHIERDFQDRRTQAEGAHKQGSVCRDGVSGTEWNTRCWLQSKCNGTKETNKARRLLPQVPRSGSEP
jgi:hypothetical protein